MQQTDELLRDRLNRRNHAEEVLERNQETVGKSQKLYAERDRFQTVICAKRDGLRTMGALDGEQGNPIRGSKNSYHLQRSEVLQKENLEYSYAQSDKDLRRMAREEQV